MVKGQAMELRLIKATVWLGEDAGVLADRAQRWALREDGLATRVLPRVGAPPAPRRFAALRSVHQTGGPGWVVLLGAELRPGPADALEVQVVRSREHDLIDSLTDELLEALCAGAEALQFAGVLRLAWGVQHEVDFMPWRFVRAATTIAALLAEKTDDAARLTARAQALWSGG
ncbi:hypothetical protein [Nannocystis pusilla]|uniref:hypothetical protein n=1 Tax=Nannocystis pusilla TaxID=889268 RepID=UPI003DA268BB